jgi:FdhD protein
VTDGAATRPTRVVARGVARAAERTLPEEVAVALSYDGTTEAVMMATPGDLVDFAYGFTLTEGIAALDDLREVAPVETPCGIDLRIWLAPGAGARLAERRRRVAGPVGCGMCGLDSLEEATRAAPALPASDLVLTPADVTAAVASLPSRQTLHDATRAVHAAGFWTPGAGLVLAREDVGRHNALDKLAGAMARGGHDARRGVLVLTSRVSLDLVQKAARIGAPALVAVSAPTTAALDLAEAVGLTVVGLARPDRFEVFTHPDRIRPEEASRVA